MNTVERRQILKDIIALTEAGLIIWRYHDDFTYISTIDCVNIFISTDDYENQADATYTISGGDSELGIDEYLGDQDILSSIYAAAQQHVQEEPHGLVLDGFDAYLRHIQKTFRDNIVRAHEEI